MSRKKYCSIISKFPHANILVIGDLILDEYIYGQVERISPEAPVPVVWAQQQHYLPGGASNVAANLRGMGAQVSVVGIVGKDDKAGILLSTLEKEHINTNGIVEVFNRKTSLKTRIIGGSQQVVRVDWENTEPIAHSIQSKIEDFIIKNIKRFDAVIIEDYGKGFVTKDVVSCAVSQARINKKIITVDPKEEHFSYYTGVTAITPNRKETENAIRDIKIKSTVNNFKICSDRLLSDEDINAAGRELIEYLKLEAVLITLGSGGMRLFEKGREPHQINTVAREVFDVSGAGDTVISVFTLALAAGASMTEAAELANYAAGIVVGKMGVVAVEQKQLLAEVKKFCA